MLRNIFRLGNGFIQREPDISQATKNKHTKKNKQTNKKQYKSR